MGYRDYKTTLIYADHAPDATQGRAFAERAFGGANEEDQAQTVGRVDKPAQGGPTIPPVEGPRQRWR